MGRSLTEKNVLSVVYEKILQLRIDIGGRKVVNDSKVTKEELIEKAKKPAQDSLKMHPYYKGKIEVLPKCVIRDINDFAIWYTLGVAEPYMEIYRNQEKGFDYTNKANMVGIVSDGTRVLGLGDIGPMDGLPVIGGEGAAS